MLTANYIQTLTATLLVMLSLFIGTTQAAVSLNQTGKYPYQGQITVVDKASRLLTIETSTLTTKGSKNYLSVNSKTYKLEVGAKLKNLPKAMRYSGLKNLKPGTLVFFNLKQGTEKKQKPTITEIWVELQ